MRRLRVPRYAAVAALFAVGLTVAAGIGHLSPGATASITSAPTPVPAISGDIREGFSIFRELPAAAMPADIATTLASPERFGRNAALAREIDTKFGRGWVVPGDDAICVIVPDGSGGYGTSCNTVESALQRGVLVGMRDREAGTGYEIVLVPDGAEATLSTGSAPLRKRHGVVAGSVTAGQELTVRQDR